MGAGKAPRGVSHHVPVPIPIPIPIPIPTALPPRPGCTPRSPGHPRPGCPVPLSPSPCLLLFLLPAGSGRAGPRLVFAPRPRLAAARPGSSPAPKPRCHRGPRRGDLPRPPETLRAKGSAAKHYQSLPATSPPSTASPLLAGPSKGCPPQLPAPKGAPGSAHSKLGVSAHSAAPYQRGHWGSTWEDKSWLRSCSKTGVKGTQQIRKQKLVEEEGNRIDKGSCLSIATPPAISCL